MLPKDDQEMEELMLEEVEVFKVGMGMTPSPVLLTLALLSTSSLPQTSLQMGAGKGPPVPKVIPVFFQEPAPVKTMTISSKRVSFAKVG